MSADPPAKGATVWITGLPAAGKTTVALLLRDTLTAIGRRACVLDGDALRQGVNQDLGFSIQDRSVSIRRTGEIARMLADSGCIAIVALISPLMEGRTAVRQRHADAGAAFVEVYADAPLSVCEARDPKGLYRRARTGEIPEFTGINSPYEEPESPDIRFGESSPPEVVERIIARLLAEEAR
jgi:bifunctional enzyme CysN/CysC